MSSIVVPVVAGLADIEAVPTGYIRGAAPPARLEYLSAMNERILALATTPYATTALCGGYDINAMNAGKGSPDRWPCAQRINVGARSMRVRFAQSVQATSATPTGVTLSSSSSGGGYANRIEVESPHTRGSVSNLPLADNTKVFDGAETWDPTPSDPSDRLIELTPALAPYVELFAVEGVHAFSGRVNQVADLSTI